MVAPEKHLSGCSHQVSTDRSLKVRQITGNRYSVDGTPADCVRLGLHHMVQDVDWVVAGINDGGNLGVDIYLSGTVAAVREGVFHGKKGIAISQYRRQRNSSDWTAAGEMARTALETIWSRSCQSHSFWNVNLPDLMGQPTDPKIILCPLDRSPLPLEFEVDDAGFRYHGQYHLREKQAGSDVDVCFSGSIAMTEIRIG